MHHGTKWDVARCVIKTYAKWLIAVEHLTTSDHKFKIIQNMLLLQNNL